MRKTIDCSAATCSGVQGPMTYLDVSIEDNQELTRAICIATSWKPATAWPTLLEQSDEE